MNLIVSGKNLTVTPAMKSLIERKIGHLDRYWQRLIRVRVEISLNRHHKRGHVVIAYGWIETPGDDIRASVEGTSFAQAVDVLSGKLERLVIKAKQRRSEA
ncbi:MAG: ribosome-associated translation inhibitor RaiA [Candidatus Kerfeldbacteria bacterium]|nr:ribosome-associated translation inhibitor RaiA [Candidatus Kerfeldbacteria bacterium]